MSLRRVHIIILITLALTLTSLQQGQFVKGQSSSSTGNTPALCDSNISSPLITAAAEKAGNSISVECAATNLIVFSFAEANSKWGFSAVDHIMSNSNYIIDDVTTSGLGSEAKIRVIMSPK